MAGAVGDEHDGDGGLAAEEELPAVRQAGPGGFQAGEEGHERGRRRVCDVGREGRERSQERTNFFDLSQNPEIDEKCDVFLNENTPHSGGWTGSSRFQGSRLAPN